MLRRKHAIEIWEAMAFRHDDTCDLYTSHRRDEKWKLQTDWNERKEKMITVSCHLDSRALSLWTNYRAFVDRAVTSIRGKCRIKVHAYLQERQLCGGPHSVSVFRTNVFSASKAPHMH